VYAGHVAVALALRAAPDAPPLWLLVLAAQGPDWVEVALTALGVPWSNPAWGPHALQWVALGAGLTAAVAAALRRRAPVGAASLGAVAYASHWPADYVTGIKPTWPGGPMVGLGVYGRPLVDLVIETLVVAAGWWLWRRGLGHPGAGGALAWALLAALVGLQLAADAAMAGALGPL
jgi:hypothetical protein